MELGLESSSEFVLKNCVNKNMMPEEFIRAVNVIKEEGILVTANVSLGVPFLDEKRQLEDAKKTVRWALDIGVNTVVVFPLHIKPGTLLSYLYKENLYDCVSLWSLVEILKDVDETERSKVQISWYKNYYNNEGKIIKFLWHHILIYTILQNEFRRRLQTKLNSNYFILNDILHPT